MTSHDDAPRRRSLAAAPATSAGPHYTVVIPTIGRRCLEDCLRSLAAAARPAPHQVIVVDDRPGRNAPLDTRGAGPLAGRLHVLTSGGRGPAAARNEGLRHVTTEWVVFLDDDVRVLSDWGARLLGDLRAAGPLTVGVQGRLRVPRAAGRRPTDWERCTAGLERAAWATADMAYRTRPVAGAGGFDERFPRAFREDADLALRLQDAGWLLARGTRSTLHPVRRTDRWVSVRAQRGNADDALMRRLHGPDWWSRAEAPRGRLPRHLAVTTAGLAAALLALVGRRRASASAAGLWLLGTAEFAWARIAPGPRTGPEIATMVGTSIAIPPLAVSSWAVGLVRHRGARPWGGTR
ncbi:glycosyltransferase [Streptomyces sp. NPDC006971]|uniref:glycosyltransferase family 2 protein n=1 Tax=Streptomyces sp. NPDC006971 TaxID=3154784 RepID=UPI0033F42AC7